MAYTDDVVKAKLSALSETQESIVTVAQWVMYHRRYAERTAQSWLQRLKDSTTPAKRLNFIYLANEVVQQSKIRKKDDFVLAFSPIIAEAIAVTAKGATNEVLQKLRRVVEVWRQRQIFDQGTQEAAEARLEEIEKAQNRAPVKKPLLGGSLFSDLASVTPAELQPLVALQQTVSRASLAATPLMTKADTEFAALNDALQPIPPPPKHAACLSALVKSLANAEDAIAESLRTRRALMAGLEKLLEANTVQLAAVEAQHAEMCSRKEAMAQKRHEVEDQIMRGLSAEQLPVHAALEDATLEERSDVGADNAETNTVSEDVERPEMERFTPPPSDYTMSSGIAMDAAQSDRADEYARPDYEELTPPPTLISTPPIPFYSAPVPAPTTISSLSTATTMDPRRRPRPSMNSPVNGVSSLKKRKMSEQEDELGDGADAMARLDADVVGMLG